MNAPLDRNVLFQTGAVLIFAFFYLVYIGKLLLQKKHGIQTNQMGKGEKKKQVLIIERLLLLATYSIVPVQLVSIFCRWTALPQAMRVAGIAAGITGDVIFTAAVVTMKDSWRAGIPDKDKTELVQNGIYRFSRNPAFLGFDLLYISILLCCFNWVLLAFTLFAILMIHLQILQEEQFLAQAFGEEYAHYKNRVFRYVGRH